MGVGSIEKRNKNGQIAGYKALGTASLKRLYYVCKRNSERRKIEWKLLFDEWKALSIRYCFYCGAAPKAKKLSYFENRIKKNDFIVPTNGIDRIDSSKPYTLTNCVACCTECNFMKHTSAMSDFLDRVKRIYENKKNYYNKG